MFPINLQVQNDQTPTSQPSFPTTINIQATNELNYMLDGQTRDVLLGENMF